VKDLVGGTVQRTATRAATRAARRGEQTRPKLIFFHSLLDGRSRRVAGFLSQILQRRRNHATFALYRVSREDRPDLLERFSVELVPTLCVVEGRHVRGRLEAPRGCREIEQFLAPWLK
jgi:hypothetical protein